MNNDADIEDNMEIETNEVEMSIWKNENKENPESGYGSEKQPSNVTSPSLSITELTTLMNNTPLADPDRQMDADQILDSEKPMDLDSVIPGSPANSPSSPQGSSLDSMRANVSPDYMDVGTDSANENPVLIIKIIFKYLFIIKTLKCTSSSELYCLQFSYNYIFHIY